MDSGGGSQSTTTNSAPWSGVQPYLTDLMSQAKSLYGQGSSYAPFSTVAPFSPQTIQGLDATQNRATNGSPVTNAADSSLTNLLSGRQDPGAATLSQWANPNNINPYLKGQFDAQSQPVIDAVNSQFSKAGRTGSTANQNALTQQLGYLANNVYGNGYDSAANRSMSAANMLSGNANQMGNQQIAAATVAPNLANQDYTDLNNLLSVGGKYDTQGQNYINDALNRWNYSQDQPWTLLSRYAGNVSGLGNTGSTSTSTTQLPSQSMLPGLLGLGTNLLSSPTSSGSSLFSNLLGF